MQGWCEQVSHNLVKLVRILSTRNLHAFVLWIATPRRWRHEIPYGVCGTRRMKKDLDFLNRALAFLLKSIKHLFPRPHPLDDDLLGCRGAGGLETESCRKSNHNANA
jgi:hypothetical protein